MVAEAHLKPGDVLAGRYRIEEKMGAGGMGVVYAALQIGLNRRVAVKVLPPELANEHVYVERFRREAETAASLGSPHIVQVTDFVRSDEATFLVMEKLVGRSLLDVLRDEQRVEEARAIEIITQILGALSVAHDAGVVHRDLKPANVFLVPLAGGHELVKLLDFGVARLTESAGYARLTQTGVVVGTPRYGSPEQVSGKPVDLRSDLFSVGVLLYGLVAGRPPFLSDGAELAIEIATREPPDPRTLNSSISPGMADVVWKSLRKDPADRFQTAPELGQALTSLGAATWDSMAKNPWPVAPVLQRTVGMEVEHAAPPVARAHTGPVGHAPAHMGPVGRAPGPTGPVGHAPAHTGPMGHAAGHTGPMGHYAAPTHHGAAPPRRGARPILIGALLVVLLLLAVGAGASIAMMARSPDRGAVEAAAVPMSPEEVILPVECDEWRSLVCDGSQDEFRRTCVICEEGLADFRETIARNPDRRAYVRSECARVFHIALESRQRAASEAPRD